MTNGMERNGGLAAPQREDVLIGRVTDGEATPADWAELETMVRADTTLWHRLAECQRAHARFEQAVEDEIAIAELVEAPDARALAKVTFVTRVRESSGWLVAAAIGLAWLGFARAPGGTGPVGPGRGSEAGIVPSIASLPAEQAFEQYKRAGLASGQVVAELPKVFVEIRPAEDGDGQDVLFVRRVVERVRAADVNVLDFKKDEHGQTIGAESKPLTTNGAMPL
ncbi:MAG TPA: hypothetical protein VG797_10340 [Phycisphaerales bacterium]|nr:hypothetical protein [Phycisphaerales bacterium]